MRQLTQCLVLFLYIFLESQAYNVLIYAPRFGHSHMVFMGKIADHLLDAGHEVVMYTPAMDPDVTSNGTNRAQVIQFDAMGSENVYSNIMWKKDPFDESVDAMEDDTMAFIAKVQRISCENQISNKELIQKTLGKFKFDIAFTEVYDYCSFGIFKLLNIPTYIVTSAIPLQEVIDNIFGVPHPLSYVPNMWGSFSDEMSYTERFLNIQMSRSWEKFYKQLLATQNELFHRYHGEDFPDLLSLAKKSALAFINSDELFEFARPITHKIIYIGGICVPKANSLSTKMEAIIAKADKGVILLSFGSVTNCTLMPLPKKMAILNAFANFPEYQFIWKYEEPEQDSKLFENYPNVHPVKWFPQVDLLKPEHDSKLFENYPNVHPVKWVPQIDLLNDPKVKAFITHGGMNSITEAIHSGTPTIAVPLFGDQEHNVAAAVKRGVAVFLGKRNLNTESLSNALKEVLMNEKYERNAKRLAAMIAKKPLKPADLIVKWTEFAAEFQDLSNLDIAGRDFSFIKYFCIDIFAPIALIAVIALFVIVKIIQFMLTKVLARISGKQKVQ